jgi:hypothetical protein
VGLTDNTILIRDNSASEQIIGSHYTNKATNVVFPSSDGVRRGTSIAIARVSKISGMHSGSKLSSSLVPNIAGSLTNDAQNIGREATQQSGIFSFYLMMKYKHARVSKISCILTITMQVLKTQRD